MSFLHLLLGSEWVLEQYPTRILYWRSVDTTHFVSQDPRRMRIASTVRNGFHWQAHLFVPGGAFLIETTRTRHEAEFAALIHAYRIITHYGL